MWSLLLASVLSAAPPAFEVKTLGGDLLVGPLAELNAEHVTVKTAGGPKSSQTAGLLEISRVGVSGKPAPSGSWVETVDGSRLAAAAYSVDGGLARIRMAGGDPIDVPVREIAAVQLQAPAAAVAAEWSRILSAEAEGDLLVVRTGDALEYHQGVIHGVTDEVVHFELDGDVLPVKRVKVQGLVYYRPAGRNLPEAVCRITDRDGSDWAARSIVLEGERLRWITPVGLEIACPAGDVVRVDFSRDKILYLSDLEPESAVWTPYFGSAENLPVLAEYFAPRRDRGLEPGPLRLDGKPYEKGLALHSRTNLVYRLPGRFRRFQATVGIDDRVRPRGHVLLVVRGDDRVLLETAVAGTDPPRAVDLDLAGVRRLAILVDFGGDLDVADHLDLCEARIVK
jgi:hypothetical protein